MAELSFSAALYGGPPTANHRYLLAALFLSVLVHVLIVVMALSATITLGGVGRGTARPVISAQLLGVVPGKPAEHAAKAASVSERRPELGVKLDGDDSSTVFPPVPFGDEAGAEREVLPDSDEGLLGVQYFPSDMLTVHPYPLTILENSDIGGMPPGDVAGRLVLIVWISATGEVAATETEFTNMPAPVHEASVSAFRQMRFMPGEIDGKRVASVMKIEMSYEDFRLSAEQ